MDRVAIEAWLDATSHVLGIEVAPEHRPGVLMNLERLAGMASLVESFALPDDIEPAPRFEASASLPVARQA